MTLPPEFNTKKQEYGFFDFGLLPSAQNDRKRIGFQVSSVILSKPQARRRIRPPQIPYAVSNFPVGEGLDPPARIPYAETKENGFFDFGLLPSAQNDRQKNRLSSFLCHPEQAAGASKDPSPSNSIRRTEEDRSCFVPSGTGQDLSPDHHQDRSIKTRGGRSPLILL